MTRGVDNSNLLIIPSFAPREVLKTMAFAKLPVLSVHPECMDNVPLHTFKEHPLWNVLNND